MPEAAATTEEPGGDHARGAVLLSSARPRRNAVSPYLGVTLDQLVAKKYGQGTILSSHSTGRGGGREFRKLQLGIQLRLHELAFPGRLPRSRCRPK